MVPYVFLALTQCKLAMLPCMLDFRKIFTFLIRPFTAELNISYTVPSQNTVHSAYTEPLQKYIQLIMIERRWTFSFCLQLVIVELYHFRYCIHCRPWPNLGIFISSLTQFAPKWFPRWLIRRNEFCVYWVRGEMLSVLFQNEVILVWFSRPPSCRGSAK